MSRAPLSRTPLPSAEPKGYREHFCHCGRFGHYGVGNRWTCTEHRPPDFLPKDRP